jgi:transcriptional regulator with GAF, ATPase, and Fis domain
MNDSDGSSPAPRAGAPLRLVVRGSREQSVAETFVGLAGGLIDHQDVVGVLDRLVGACVQLLGATAAAVLLADQEGTIALVAPSNETARVLEDLQLRHGEGPGLDCARTGAAVTSEDLEADCVRWPLFAPAARAAGFDRVLTVPLRVGTQTIGALSIFRSAREVPPANTQLLAQAFADVVTTSILRKRAAQHTTIVVEQLQHAVESRVVIEQAKGIVGERHALSMDAALDALRRHARNRNHKLTEIARGVVRGEIDPVAGVVSPQAV